MRLLHLHDLRSEEFFDEKIPSYAILSHRWVADEVSFSDFLAGRKRDGAGFAKIVECCKYVAEHSKRHIGNSISYTASDPTNRELVTKEERQEWVWNDTCCIDKASSAELFESTNSMYQSQRDLGS